MRGCNRLAYQQPLAQQPRQLGDICNNPLRLVAAEHLGPRPPARLVLKIREIITGPVDRGSDEQRTP